MAGGLVYDRVCMTVSVGGTGVLTLGSAVSRFRTFAAAGAANSAVVAYVIEDGTNWEYGDGTYSTTGPTLTRTTIVASSNSGAAIDVSLAAVVYSSAKIDDLCAVGAQTLTVAQAAQVRTNQDTAWREAMAAVNLAQNGFHQVSQINGLNSVSIADGASAYISDGWVMEVVGTSITGQVIADPFTTNPAIKYGQKLNITVAKPTLSAGDYVIEYTRLEGSRVANLGFGGSGANYLLVSRVMKSNIAITGYIWLRNAAKNRTYLRSFTLAANTEKLISCVFPGDTTGTWVKDTTIGMEIGFGYAAGTTFRGTVNAWNAGNYYGTTSSTNLAATANNYIIGSGLLILPYMSNAVTEAPLVNETARYARPFSEDLRDCQRYYEKIGAGVAGAWSAADTAQLGVNFKVPKRQVSGMTLSLSQNNPSILEPSVATRTGSGSALSVAYGPTVNGAIVSVNGFSGATATNPAIMTDDFIIVDNRL